jgi:hypothetical protein
MDGGVGIALHCMKWMGWRVVACVACVCAVIVCYGSLSVRHIHTITVQF